MLRVWMPVNEGARPARSGDVMVIGEARVHSDSYEKFSASDRRTSRATERLVACGAVSGTSHAQ
jgi:hypothetical protein